MHWEARGLRVATDLFNERYGAALQQYLEGTSQLTANMVAVCPATGRHINAAHTAFVGDLASRIVDRNGRAVEQHGHVLL